MVCKLFVIYFCECKNSSYEFLNVFQSTKYYRIQRVVEKNKSDVLLE